MYENFLDFEKPIAEIKKKLDSIDTSSLHGNNEYKGLEKKKLKIFILKFTLI